MWPVRKERQQQCCNDFIHAPLPARRARDVHITLIVKNKHVHTRHAAAPALCPFKMQASYVLPTKLTQYYIPSVLPPEAVVAPAWPDSPIGQNKQQFFRRDATRNARASGANHDFTRSTYLQPHLQSAHTSRPHTASRTCLACHIEHIANVREKCQKGAQRGIYVTGTAAKITYKAHIPVSCATSASLACNISVDSSRLACRQEHIVSVQREPPKDIRSGVRTPHTSVKHLYKSAHTASGVLVSAGFRYA